MYSSVQSIAVYASDASLPSFEKSPVTSKPTLMMKGLLRRRVRQSFNCARIRQSFNCGFVIYGIACVASISLSLDLVLIVGVSVGVGVGIGVGIGVTRDRKSTMKIPKAVEI